MALPACTHQIPVVRRYTYLGSLITDSSVSFRAEILHRVRLGKSGVLRARTRLRNATFSYRSRLQL
eukprot:4664228-Prorocentrum_lima.AAC.1